jgi:hypothetical protein
MKIWQKIARQLALYSIVWIGVGVTIYAQLTPTSYSAVPHAYGNILSLSENGLIIDIKNTDAFYPPNHTITTRQLSYDDDTIVTKQRFLSQDNIIFDATPPNNVPTTELKLGQKVYIFFDPASGYAYRIYIGEPILPF